jgi:hypothetical protein
VARREPRRLGVAPFLLLSNHGPDVARNGRPARRDKVPRPVRAYPLCRPFFQPLPNLTVEDAVEERSVLFGQLERVEAILERLGKLHDRQFDKREKEILEG